MSHGLVFPYLKFQNVNSIEKKCTFGMIDKVGNNCLDLFGVKNGKGRFFVSCTRYKYLKGSLEPTVQNDYVCYVRGTS